jgi:uncharacterized membrane protein
MNEAHVHLLVNHFPIIGVIIGFLVLVTGFIFRNEPVKRIALGIFVFASLFAVPTFISGGAAEDIVERIPGISESHIEAHEEIAEVYIWIISTLGIVSLLTFLSDYSRTRYSKWLYLLAIVVAMGTMVVATQVGTTGGEIRHSEIRARQTSTDADKVNLDADE